MIFLRLLLSILLAALAYGSASPSLAPPSAWAALLHFLTFCGLSFLTCLAFQTSRTRMAAVSFVFLYSLGIEALQYFHPPRQASFEDAAVNGLGCLVGVAFFLLGAKLFLIWKDRTRHAKPMTGIISNG